MLAFVGLCLLLLIGHVLRTRVRLLQWMYLPACVIAGLVGLAVIQVVGVLAFPASRQPWTIWGRCVLAADEAFMEWTPLWGRLPGFLINIVFACLFLGVKLPRFSSLLKRSGTQLAYGQIVAWGQYVVGVGLVVFALGGVFGLPDMFGGVLPVGFEGGHGTAGGMGPVFEDLGWPAGKDFALASATAGILSAIVVGMVLVNLAARRGWTTRRQSPADVPEDDSIGIIPVGRRPSAGKLTVKADAIESFTLHIAVIGLALLLGWLMKLAVAQLDRLHPWLAANRLFASVPMFPLCMLGGLIVQIWEQKFDRHKLIDLGLTRRVQNTALDFLVVAAIATIRLEVVAAGAAPLLILVAAGIAWNVFCVLVLARRLLPDAWFERSIAEMGQSMGVTATGLLLLRVVDPDYRSPAADAFATKQLLHEPIMGGGLWTSMAIPLLAVWGGPQVFLVASGAVTAWLTVLIAARALRRRRGAT